jgi:hypothetical protein
MSMEPMLYSFLCKEEDALPGSMRSRNQIAIERKQGTLLPYLSVTDVFRMRTAHLPLHQDIPDRKVIERTVYKRADRIFR